MVGNELEKLRAFKASLRKFAGDLIELMREADRLEVILTYQPKQQAPEKQKTDVQAPPAVDLRPEKLTYTLSEVVKATGVGRSTLYRMRKDGELVFWKCGNKTLIKADELRRWLASMPQL